MNFPTAIKTVIKKSFTKKGRATPSEYWWWQLFFILLYFISTYSLINSKILKLQIHNNTLSFLFNILYLLTALFFIPTISVSIRRMHDVGKNGWWSLLYAIPAFLILLRIIGLAMSFLHIEIILLPLSYAIFYIFSIVFGGNLKNLAFLDFFVWFPIIIFWLLCVPESQPHDNQYGSNPNAQADTIEDKE
ncbi:MAG: DUF805 domain-containing protein [Neisseriaceae bacterium]|nr:DUF805 domain-containing protein [Neisseriaceae bacterium]MBR5676256.1 DUF805 domain-containing protein [Neisseriaceae bacterium]